MCLVTDASILTFSLRERTASYQHVMTFVIVTDSLAVQHASTLSRLLSLRFRSLWCFNCKVMASLFSCDVRSCTRLQDASLDLPLDHSHPAPAKYTSQRCYPRSRCIWVDY